MLDAEKPSGGFLAYSITIGSFGIKHQKATPEVRESPQHWRPGWSLDDTGELLQLPSENLQLVLAVLDDEELHENQLLVLLLCQLFVINGNYLFMTFSYL